MRVASLGSGSEGNALLVESGATRVMLDCGFSMRETTQRLARLGLQAEDLSALFITHEHADHIGSAYRFATRYGLPLYMSHGTYSATQKQLATQSSARTNEMEIIFCQADQPCLIGELTLHPYTVPHDAREPLQCVFQAGDKRIGVLTDVGVPTPYLIERLQNLNVFVLECNHDSAMLAASAYPASLKSRIGGEYGHLANHLSAQILKQVLHPGLQAVVAAHLSQQNNSYEHALTALSSVYDGEIHIACQQEGFDWLTVQTTISANAQMFECTA